MKSYNYLTVSIIAFAFTVAGCNRPLQNEQNDIATPVTVKELKKGSISRLINTTGTSMSTYSADLASQMSGAYHLQINPRTGKPFKLGDKVSKGQVIVRLEDREYENGIAFDAKELSLEIAEQEYVKQKALYEKNGVILSE
ncbi:MAG: efflux transporter periplasmic adaptor subunit, partial [Prevotellaceae bacterium]|nr:efflux transporter periplasmic adaptor subunit [Prevotellaceae bacterium]